MRRPIAKSIAITPGDPCGIGPEIIARAFLDAPHTTANCFVAGDFGLMQRAAALVDPGAQKLKLRLLTSPEQA